MTQATPRELKDFPVGRVIAERYEIEQHLGHGGMGLVVKARDLNLDGESIVLKILYPRLVQGRAIIARFKREVLLNRQLSHPNIVKIFDLGSIGSDTYYITMEFVEGESLAAKLARTSPHGLPFDQIPQ